jgi:hypothetical protein
VLQKEWRAGKYSDDTKQQKEDIKLSLHETTEKNAYILRKSSETKHTNSIKEKHCRLKNRKVEKETKFTK